MSELTERLRDYITDGVARGFPDVQKDLAEAAARIEELEAALRPFAENFGKYPRETMATWSEWVTANETYYGRPLPTGPLSTAGTKAWEPVPDDIWRQHLKRTTGE